jgi:uncharacterized protein (DUF302 family)
LSGRIVDTFHLGVFADVAVQTPTYYRAAERHAIEERQPMTYYIAKTVSRTFDQVVADVTAKLKAQGFGVLTDIDVQATLRSKLGVETPKYRILGACNPKLAHEALQREDRLGVLLPCNVIVRETADRRVEVASIDPVSSMERTENPALRQTAEQVQALLSAAVSAVEG